MKKAEIILTLIALSTLLMKLCLVSGITIFIVMSLSLLSCFYFYTGFAFFNGMSLIKMTKGEKYKDIRSRRVVGGVATGLALGLAVIGILFKFQSFPGASFNLIMGIFSTGVIIAISTIKYFKTRDAYYTTILKRVLVYFTICLTLYLVPRNTFFEFMHRDRPAYVKVMEKAWDNPGNEALQDSVDAAWDKTYKK